MLFKTTTDHDEIRTWVDEHGGRPSLRERKDTMPGIIDINFDTLENNNIEETISWDEFFDIFDSLNMQFRFDSSGEEKKDFSYSILSQTEEGQNDPDVGTVNEIEMPEDVPIENVIASAPAAGSPDSLDDKMLYT